MPYNKAEIEEWFRQPIREGQTKPPKPGCTGKLEAKGVVVDPTWQPKACDVVHMVHENGKVVECTIDGHPDRGVVWVAFPGMQGVRAVWLRNGRMRKDQRWAMDHREIRAIRERFDRNPSSG